MATKAAPKKAATRKKAVQPVPHTRTRLVKKDEPEHTVDAKGRPIIRVRNLSTGNTQDIVLQDLLDFMNRDTSYGSQAQVEDARMNTLNTSPSSKPPQRSSIIMGRLGLLVEELSMMAYAIRRNQQSVGFIGGSEIKPVPDPLLGDESKLNIVMMLDEIAKYLSIYRMATAENGDLLQDLI